MGTYFTPSSHPQEDCFARPENRESRKVREALARNDRKQLLARMGIASLALIIANPAKYAKRSLAMTENSFSPAGGLLRSP